MTPLQERRQQIVLAHMDAANRLDFDAALATFAHPRYELGGLGRAFDGAEAVAEYFVTSREPFPDQRNEMIALHHTDDAVVVEFCERVYVNPGDVIGQITAQGSLGRDHR